MINISELQAKLRLTGNLVDIENNHEMLSAALEQIETAERTVRALINANRGTCRHSSVRRGRDNLDWCDYCGKCLTQGH